MSTPGAANQRTSREIIQECIQHLSHYVSSDNPPSSLSGSTSSRPMDSLLFTTTPPAHTRRNSLRKPPPINRKPSSQIDAVRANHTTDRPVLNGNRFSSRSTNSLSSTTTLPVHNQRNSLQRPPSEAPRLSQTIHHTESPKRKKGILAFISSALGLNKTPGVGTPNKLVRRGRGNARNEEGVASALPLDSLLTTPELAVNGLLEQTTMASISESACERLIGRAFAPRELPSLIEAIFANKDEGDMVRSLPRNKVQTCIDVMDEAMEMPDLSAGTRTECLKSLYRMCGRHALLPRTLKIIVRYDRTSDALCRGGFADVWRGKHYGRDVAVKVLRTYSNSDFQRIVGRFCKEVVMWKFLRHPNVLQLIGVMMTETRFEMVSDWMVNGNINDFVKARPYVDRFRLLIGVSSGLIYIHDQGMIHGDLKGANILIDETGNPRLADFGLLTIISNHTNIFTSSSYNQGGTSRWMAPELINPEQFGSEDNHPTIHSDCYALGMVIYETISGKPPFHQHAELTVITKVVAGERPTREAGFAGSLWEMLRKCWKPWPNGRPSIEDVLRCLEKVSD